MTVAQAVERLKIRRVNLVADRDRIRTAAQTDIAGVNSQIVAIDSVLTGLSDADKAATIDSLLTALGMAGVTLTFD